MESSPWHAFCNSTVPGAVGFVVFSVITLRVTRTLNGAVNAAFCCGQGSQHMGGAKENGVEGAMFWQCCAPFGWVLSS